MLLKNVRTIFLLFFFCALFFSANLGFAKTVLSATGEIWTPGQKTPDLWKEAMNPSSGLNNWKWVRTLYMTIIVNILASGSPTGEPPDFSGSSTAVSMDWVLPGKSFSGVFSLTGNFASTLYNQSPFGNFNQYMASVGNLFKPTYAAGYDVLQIIQGVWKLSRNVAYIALISILLAYGIMIMLKSKIDPRTTATISNTLPNLVVSLIFITFSFAIAGFTWDIWRVTQKIASNAFNQSLYGNISAAPTGPAPVTKGFNCPAWEFFGKNESFNSYYPCNFSVFDVWKVFGVWYGVNTIFSGSIAKDCPPGVPPEACSVLGLPIEASGILSLAIFFAVLSACIKTLFALMTSYVRFFLNTVAGPISILMGALPGNTNNISSWIKGYLSAALSFTGVFIVLNIAYYIMLMGAIGGAPIDNLSETPPLIATTGTEAYKIIVFGIVLLLPAIPAAIDDVFQTAPSGAVSRAAGDASQALKKIPIVGGFLG